MFVLEIFIILPTLSIFLWAREHYQLANHTKYFLERVFFFIISVSSNLSVYVQYMLIGECDNFLDLGEAASS